MAATKSASYVRGRAIRATKLDACGNPVVGAESVITSKGFTSVAFTANTEDGEEINVTNANGDTCVRVPAKPKFLGYTVEITFCNVDPDVFALLTGQRTVVNHSGDVVGFTMDTAISAGDVNFALEVWAGVPAGAGCEPGATASFGYFLLPFLQGGVVGDFTIENSEITFSVTGAVTLDGNSWGDGLYYAVNDASGNPSLLPDPLLTTDHLYQVLTTLAPPEIHLGARPYMDPAAPALTGSTATDTLLSVDFAAAPAGTEPFWVDFGDGTWDYSADGSAITHVYEAAGTYNYVFYRGSSSEAGSITVAAA